MQLRVLLPSRILVDREVRRVVAEAENGSFGILERHADIAAALVPGILVLEPVDAAERYVGIDVGVLVKCGAEVLVATRDAVEGDDLDDLRRAVRERFVQLDDRGRQAQTALARLEAGVVRRFVEYQEQG
ncbi:MAG: F0F1 ATP synthase subunit epsilon [Pseudomonadota bacterium]